MKRNPIWILWAIAMMWIMYGILHETMDFDNGNAHFSNDTLTFSDSSLKIKHDSLIPIIFHPDTARIPDTTINKR